MKRKLAISAVVIALIGLVVSLALLRKPAAKPAAVTQTPAKQNPPIIQTGTVPSLAIDSPQPAGDTITVAKVALPIHGFVVIRDAPCPAILVESGFLSNAGEEQRLLAPDYRDKLAKGIADGILEYRRTTE